MALPALAIAVLGGFASLLTAADADPCKHASDNSDPTYTIPTIPCTPESLSECLTSRSVPHHLPSTPDFDVQTQPFNIRLPFVPAVLVIPESIPHIQIAVLCAAQFSVHVQARSGGHSYASHSTGGEDGAMILDVQAFKDIVLDPNTLVARIGGGVKLGDLAFGLHEQGEELFGPGGGRAVSHGTCPSVGVGGHFTHGGYGFSSRRWGLGMDAITAMTVVLANGTLLHISHEENTELFFGFRGAAENFGIVISFEMETQQEPESIVHFAFDMGGVLGGKDGGRDGGVVKAAALFKGIQDVALDEGVIGRDIGFEVFVTGYSISITGTYFGTREQFKSVVEPAFVDVLGVEADIDVQGWISVLDTLGVDGLAAALEGQGNGNRAVVGRGQSNFYAKSLTTPESAPLAEEAMTAYFEYIMAEGRSEAPVLWFSLIALWGGPDSQIAAHNSEKWGAYARRDVLWVFQHYGYVANNETFPEDSGMAFVEGLNRVIPGVMQGVDFGGYKNYDDPELSRTEAHDTYYGPELAGRLRRLKREVDPGNVFAHPQSFEP